MGYASKRCTTTESDRVFDEVAAHITERIRTLGEQDTETLLAELTVWLVETAGRVRRAGEVVRLCRAPVADGTPCFARAGHEGPCR
ncbi:hypothetical protein [Nocardioides sp. GXZ039]|uniref:hypothetical protein n=1 Tax=Nocardioides sp. GXZ039 TaxID=3136018 RepID=UPI0030F3B465